MQDSPRIQDAKLRRRRQQEALAFEVLEECRVQLMLKFRFLDLALWRMKPVALPDAGRYPMATDAECVYLDPPRLIVRYRESYEEAVRDYLHMVMHCVFRHPFDEDHPRKDAWWLACDIVAESAAMELCAHRFESEDDVERRRALSELRLALGRLTPQRVYKLLVDVARAPEGASLKGISQSTVVQYRDLFERCNHEVWPANADKNTAQNAQPGDLQEAPEEPDEPGAVALPEQADAAEQENDDARGGAFAEADECSESDDEGEASDGDGAFEEDAAAGAEGDRRTQPPADEDDREKNEQLRKEWEDISKEIEMNMDTFSREWTEEAGDLIMALRAANRTRYDYSEFLRRFMVFSEEMRINHDEFDYIFYSYGMELYGDMPLVEPLEYKEEKRVRSFVIAIDTSQSVSGALVRRFIDHTFHMLKSSEDYARKVDIHIVQCDSRVQGHTRLGDLRDIDAVMSDFRVRGFGGTDFRPVFDYVETLRDRGELREMQGLIYFTDGLGQFPEKAPDYDVAFVLMTDEGADPPPVPPWAMKLLIDETDIERFGSEN